MQSDPTKLDVDELARLVKELREALDRAIDSIALRMREAINEAYRQGVADERKHRTGVDTKVKGER
jgi:hypothetical protein